MALAPHPLAPYVAAGYPAVAVQTAEEDRLTRSILDRWPDRTVLAIAAVGGLRDARTGQVRDPLAGYPAAIAAAAEQADTILLLLDWQHVARNAPAYRALLAQIPALKRHGSLVVLIAPAWTLPAELAHEIPVIDYDLPTREELGAALDVVAESAGTTLDASLRSACLDSAAGLTLGEAENAYSLAYVTARRFDPARIQEEKLGQIRRSGYLEVYPPVPADQVGGLGALKAYLADEVLPCRDDPLLRVRGILLVGVPGTGKSLAAKACGALLGWPVLRCDISALKGSLVGQSEQQMRSALALAEAVAPCVLFLDEVEKAVGGHASSAQSDSGVTLGMVGRLLTWLQEHTAAIVTLATCNDYGKLPAEMTRAGRFDERFFVDLPSRQEREEIATVHLARFGATSAELSARLGGLTDGWTGAEIEQAAKSAARRTRRQITAESLVLAASEIRPISRVRGPEIKALRDWARDSLRPANTPEAPPAAGGARRLVI